MAGTRQPIEVLQAKGRKHLTKAEIENRQKTQLKAASDAVQPPKYLKATQKKRFYAIADELMKLDVISNLDCDALARLIIVEDEFKEINRAMRKMSPTIKKRVEVERKDENGESTKIMVELDEIVANPDYNALQVMRSRAFKECRQGAADFGLTVSSRCRLVVPAAKEPPKENKFVKYAKVVGNE